MRCHELAERISRGQSPVVVDVRTGYEFRKGHIAGALHAPVWKILLRQVPLPRDMQAELVVLCELGPRALAGKLVLGWLGFTNVALLSGHMAAWRRQGLPLVR